MLSQLIKVMAGATKNKAFLTKEIMVNAVMSVRWLILSSAVVKTSLFVCMCVHSDGFRVQMGGRGVFVRNLLG